MTHSFSPKFSVTIVASWRYFCATPPRIERVVCPFDLRVFGHYRMLNKSKAFLRAIFPGFVRQPRRLSDVCTLWKRWTGVSALRSFGLAFEDVAAGEFLEAVDFVPGFFGVPLEFGGHEGGDVLGTRAGMEGM